jgi:DeoR family ulaG and ulaABCDEF operon transcriptional repressor
MLESERHRFIAKLVSDRAVISIADLVKTMPFVSEATIRRDIKTLVENGQIRRVRGGVESMSSMPSHIAPVATNQPVAVAQKKAIAREAAKFLKDGESIIVAAGTTTQAMVDFLQERQLDILTNSVAVAMRLFDSSRNRITVPGGAMLREQGIILSPFENDSVDHFSAQKMFTSCYGIKRTGLMETDPLIVQAQRRLLGRAEEVIVLADSRKLRQRSSMVVVPLSRISTLITDDGAEAAELEPFRRAGIKVIVAESSEVTRFTRNKYISLR